MTKPTLNMTSGDKKKGSLYHSAENKQAEMPTFPQADDVGCS